MKYRKASIEKAEEIYQLVQQTISITYPNYYPKEVVDYFCSLHNKRSILEDIKNGQVGILIHEEQVIGTGSYIGNHVTRVYVLPSFQGKGYGSYIMNCIENEIARNYDKIYLEASLSACRLYENRGYKTIKHEKYIVDAGVVLVYEIMEKPIFLADGSINYDGKSFCVQTNTENGEVDKETVFLYHQKEHIIWADYCGGIIKKGYLLGTTAENGELNFYYQHINVNKQFRIGKCHSVPHILENGKLEMIEEWEWLDNEKTRGSSILIEL